MLRVHSILTLLGMAIFTSTLSGAEPAKVGDKIGKL